MKPGPKLRAAVLLPAVVIMLGMVVLVLKQPDLARPLTAGIPIVSALALGFVFVWEYLHRRRDPQPVGRPSPNGARLRKLRIAVLLAGAVFVVGMTILALTQPPDVLPLLLILTIVVAGSTTAIALVLDRQSRH